MEKIQEYQLKEIKDALQRQLAATGNGAINSLEGHLQCSETLTTCLIDILRIDVSIKISVI